MKRYLMMLWVCLVALAARADAGVQVKAAAGAEVVEVGEQFRVSFTVNTQDVSDFRWADMENFNIDMGPSRSSQSSFQMINGRTSQSSSLTYTYIISALKEGTFTLPAATATVGGKQYRSNVLSVRVIPSTGGGASSQQGGAGSHQRMRTQNAGDKITGKDLFVSVTADKKRVYEQEAVVLTYKVYSLVSLSQLAGGMPDLEGFHVQEVKLPQQKNLKMETHNGRTYGTVVWRQYVLFPQRSGKLTIPSINFEGIVVQQNRNIDPFEAFFNGGSTMVEVKKTIVAPSLTLDVAPLPSPKPDNFSGAVGKFSLNASLSPDRLKANEALTLNVTVSGRGNMKLMQAPVVDFPKDFETYDAKVTDHTKVGADGVSGNKAFEYLAVPRHAGDYELPGVQFCYFDTDSRSYKTLTSKNFSVHVDKGKGGGASVDYTNREDVKLLASDVRYIHQGDVRLRQRGDSYFGTSAYAWSYAVPLLALAFLVWVFRKQAMENANVAKMRNKKANRVAAKRLKLAASLMKANRSAEFYEEVLKALWGYVGDKLNLPAAELNKDNVSEKLQAKGVEGPVVEQLLATLNECEFARYAPGDPAQTMDKIYAGATEAINKLESSVKR